MKHTGDKCLTPGRISTLVLIIIFTAILHKGSATEYQRFRVTPQSVEVMEGEDVFLQCAVDHQQGKAQWTKDGFALGFERHVPGYPRYYYAGDPTLGEHHLVITGVTLTEDGEYQCQVGPTMKSPPIWAAANVTVLLAPTSVRVVGWENGSVVEVMSGSSLTLECLVADARPAPGAAWYRGGTQVDPALQEDRVEASRLARRWSVRSQLVVRARAQDDGKPFSCRAIHPALRADHHHHHHPASLAASITLSVLHPPGQPTISGYETGEVLQAEERRTLTCRVSGGNPRPWVLWYREGRLLDDTTDEDSAGVYNSYEVLVTAEEDGAVYECSVTNDLLEYPVTANVTLTVYYAPRSVTITGRSEVEEGGTLDLTCVTSVSNPPASLSWSVAGEMVEATKSAVERNEDGGWVTSSDLTQYQLKGGTNLTEVRVECRAVNPAVDHVVRDILDVTITKPPGIPVLEGDLWKEVIAGTTLQVACSSTGGHPPPSMRIFKKDELILTDIQREGPNLTLALAEVEVSPADNGAKITCEASNSPHTTPVSTFARLTVLFAPWEVEATVNPLPVEAGGRVSLSCVSSSSLPPSNITWSSEGVLLEGTNAYTSEGAFEGTTTRSELHLDTTAEDNGRVIVCTAGNGIDDPVQKEVILDVLHPPIWMDKPPEQLDVFEGADLVITASAASNPGPVREETELESGGGELQLSRVSRANTGSYSVQASSPHGFLNATFFLNVLYGPERVMTEDRVTADVGATVSVECSANGNPPPTLTWTRDYSQNSTGQGLGKGVGVAYLVVESASWADTGVYFCHASNIVNTTSPVRTKFIVTQPVMEVEEMGGRRRAWAAVGEPGRLLCRVRAAPPPKFHWTTRDGRQIETDEHYIVHHPQLADGLVLWSSVLEVRVVGGGDYGMYQCTAHNQLGSTTLTRTLSPPSEPHPPYNLTVSSVSSGSASLTWSPSYQGGRPQGYTVSYRPVAARHYQMVEVPGGDTAEVTVEGLSPGTEYVFRLQAKNPQGVSPFVQPPVTATTHGVSGHPSISSEGGVPEGSRTMVDGSSRMPRLMLLLITLTGAALLALNVAIIGCFVRRRAINRNASASSSTKNVSLDVYGVTPASTPGANHNQALLSLTNMSPNISNTPPPYQEEDQTNVDDCDHPSLVIPNAAGHAAPPARGTTYHSTSRQNGMVGRDASSLFLTNRSVSPQDPARFLQGHNATDDLSSLRTSSPVTHGDSVSKDAKESGGPQANEEVASLCSSTYDSLPHDPRPPQQGHATSAPYPSADQASLSSYHSDYSRSYEYSHGYVRPLYHPSCPHHHHHYHHSQTRPPPPLYQTPHDAHVYQQQQQQEVIQAPAPYSSLIPSGLYSLSSDAQETRASPPSLVSGSPSGYATLGPRRRKPTPSKFASLQRPRSSHAHAHVHPSPQRQQQQQQQQRPSPGEPTEDAHQPQAQGWERSERRGSSGPRTFHTFVPVTHDSSSIKTHAAALQQQQQEDAGVLDGSGAPPSHPTREDTNALQHHHSQGPGLDSSCPRHGNVGHTQALTSRNQRTQGGSQPFSDSSHGVKVHPGSTSQLTGGSHHQRSASPKQRTSSPVQYTDTLYQRTGSPNQCTNTPNQRSISPSQRNGTANQRTSSPNQRTTSSSQHTQSPTSSLTSSPVPRTSTHHQRTSTSHQRTGSPSQLNGSSVQHTCNPSKRTSTSTQRTGSPNQFTSSSNQRTGSPNQFTSTSTQRTGSPNQFTSSSNQRTGSPNQLTGSSDQRTGSPNQRTSNSNQRSTGSPNQHPSSSLQHTGGPSQRTDTSKQRTTSPSQRTCPWQEKSTKDVPKDLVSGSPSVESSGCLPEALPAPVVVTGRPRFPHDFVRHIPSRTRTGGREDPEGPDADHSADTNLR